MDAAKFASSGSRSKELWPPQMRPRLTSMRLRRCPLLKLSTSKEPASNYFLLRLSTNRAPTLLTAIIRFWNPHDSDLIRQYRGKTAWAFRAHEAGGHAHARKPGRAH